MKLAALSGRCAKEILRDPLDLAFGLGFPVAILSLLSLIGANAPLPLFEVASLAPGISVFGLSFFTLFTAALLARDRESALLQRLYTAPLAAAHFLGGYALPMLPIALAQSCVCYAAAALWGLPLTLRLLPALALQLPTALFFIALGLLLGSVLGQKQVGGVCGALLTNLTAWLGGIWFDPAMAGGVFRRAAEVLPFLHAVELARAALSGATAALWGHLAWVLGWAAAAVLCAVWLFLRQMRRQ